MRIFALLSLLIVASYSTVTLNKNGDLIMNSLLDGNVILSSGRGDIIVEHDGTQISVLDQLQVIEQVVGQLCWLTPNSPLPSWTGFPQMLHPAWGIATAVIGSKIFVIGGFDGTQVLNIVQVYDVNADSWSYYPPLKSARAFPYSAVSIDGTNIYVFGGTQGPTGIEIDLTSVEVYNVQANSWVLLPLIQSMPYAHYSGCSAMIGDEVYFFGGQNRNSTGGNSSPQISSYNTQTNIWKVFALTMPVGRWNAVAVAVNNNIYILGGINETGIVTNLVDMLDTVHMQWSVAPNTDLGKQKMGAINFNGLVALVGGSSVYLGTSGDVMVLNPRLNLWKTNVIGKLSNTRDSFGVALVGKTIYVIGGRTFVQTVSSPPSPVSVVGATEGTVGCF